MSCICDNDPQRLNKILLLSRPSSFRREDTIGLLVSSKKKVFQVRLHVVGVIFCVLRSIPKHN